MISVCYISRLTFGSDKANVYNTAKTCEALALAGAHLALVSSDNGAAGQKAAQFRAKYRLTDNFEIVSLCGWSNAFKYGGRYQQSKLEVLFSNAALCGELWRRRRSTDAVYLRDPSILPVALFARFVLRKPVFFETHAVLVGVRNKFFGDTLARISRGVIAITHALAEYYRKLNPNTVVSYCTAAEPERFAAVTASKSELRAKLQLPADKFLLCYTGNLTRTGNNDSYGVEDIIAAMPHLPEDTVFVGVGKKNPHDTKELEELAKRLGVAERVRLLPWVPKDAVAEYLLASDVLLIPASGARIGNAPTKMFDYLISGVPVVAADTVAIREVLTDRKTALLVEYKKPEAWARAVSEIRNDSGLRGSLIAEAKKEGMKYTWEKRGQEIFDFLQSASA